MAPQPNGIPQKNPSLGPPRGLPPRRRSRGSALPLRRVNHSPTGFSVPVPQTLCPPFPPKGSKAPVSKPPWEAGSPLPNAEALNAKRRFFAGPPRKCRPFHARPPALLRPGSGKKPPEKRGPLFPVPREEPPDGRKAELGSPSPPPPTPPTRVAWNRGSGPGGPLRPPDFGNALAGRAKPAAPPPSLRAYEGAARLKEGTVTLFFSTV